MGTLTGIAPLAFGTVLENLKQRPVNLGDALERVTGPESSCRTQDTLYYIVLNL